MANKTKKKIPAKDIEWDLSDLYSAINDPKIEKDKKEIQNLVKEFIKKYKGKINSKDLTPEFLLQTLKDYEKIFEKSYIYSIYASLIHSKDTISSEIGKFYQESQEFYNLVNSQLIWFELEWTNLEDLISEKILKDEKLKDYKHYLKQVKVLKPFRLSEKEETILTKKSQTSGLAFTRLYDEIDSSIKYDLKINGEEKKLSYAEITSYMNINPDRNIREKAFCLKIVAKEL